MKTFLVVALYTSMVAALDLGGAVWNHLRDTHPPKAAVATVAPAAAPVKTGSANPVSGTNLSDT